MGRKELAVLLVLLTMVALFNVSGVYAERNVNSSVPTVQMPALLHQSKGFSKSPEDKIEPAIFEILNNGGTDELPEINGVKYLPVYIVASKDVIASLEKIKNVRIVGHTEIEDMHFYLGVIPANRDSIKDLKKIATVPEVEMITRTNPFEPVGVMKEQEYKDSEGIQKVWINVPRINRKIDVSKLERFKVKSMAEPMVMKYRKESPLRHGQISIAARDIPAPNDYFAIYHHGALNSWFNLGITGNGVNVAVIDSGVDFGNPDLQDAYAVDINPDSPYYGWPIAYSGHSMIWYLIMNQTFPGYVYSWYSETSTELPYYFVYGNVSVGYKGNYTSVFTTMSLANILDDYERASFINETLNWMGVGKGSRILLVDDDGNTTLDEFYVRALALLNITPDVYEVLPANSSGPNLTTLSDYDAVIWFTGPQYEHVLTPDDIINLENYLDSGGKLWLISEDLYPEMPLNSTFMGDYLHVVNIDPDYPVPTVLKTPHNTYRAGSIYYGLYGSPTDAFSDFITGDNKTEVLAMGYEALVALSWTDPETNKTTEMTIIKFPLSNDLTVPSRSGVFHFGLHPDLALWKNWNGGYVILADPENASGYTTVYADITPLTIETSTMNLTYVDFNEDTGHTKDNPVIQVDFWNAREKGFGSDGYADLSGGLVYFIADGNTPIPYSDVVASRWSIPLEIPENGNLVAFMIGTDYIGGGDHGTLCAAAVGARGRTYGGLTFGTAVGAKIIAEGSLYSGGSWLDYVFFAVEGYDGKPGTGDEALVVSNSYGASSIIAKGYTWDDRFLYYITHFYTPWVTFLFAAGNGGPGYGTVTSEGASPGVITVGAAVEWGYRGLLGYDDGPWVMENAYYGDVADFSNKGPNALGMPDPDVLAVGEFAFGSLPLNSVGNGFTASDLWSGTSLATPMAAGITALVYQAYYQKHGTWPTADEVKSILMSTAKNVNHDVFSQGAGFLDAYSAAAVAMGIDGIIVTPSSWQAGITGYPAFANIIVPGENASQVFEIQNVNATGIKNVTVSPEIFEKIGEVELDVEGNSWRMYQVDQYIPSGTDLMKVTLYTDYENFDPNMDYTSDAYPWFRVFDVTLVNGTQTLSLIQQGSKEGTVASAMIGNPLNKFHDAMVIQIRDIKRFYGKTETYPAKLKLEFYRRVPWKWVKVSNSTISIPPANSTKFVATITVPEDALPGIYEGAIYLKYDGRETTIPVSVVVASPVENFEFGGDRAANGLYDNSNVYGYFDWGWRYESGDWRLLYFNVTQDNSPGRYLVVDVDWAGTLNDINLHILGPTEDSWSANVPSVFGPYTLTEIGHSDDGYVAGGLFKWQTTSGTNREQIAAPLHKGLNAIWLHNVLFDGKTASATFQGHVGTVQVSPYQWVEETPLKSGHNSFTFRTTVDLGQVKVEAYGLTAPQVYTNQLAPATGDSDYYYVNVTDSALLTVQLTSDWDERAGLDLDLIVYYYDPVSSKYIQVGSSLTSSSDETVSLKFPKSGRYLIEVNSYDNPAYGDAIYNLSILSLEKRGNIHAKIEKISEDTYKVTAAYELRDNEFVPGKSYLGAIYIGSQYNPLLVQIPVQVTVNPEVALITGEPTRVREGSVKTVTINLNTSKLVGALQLKLEYDPQVVKIEEISVPDELQSGISLAVKINNTEGLAEVGIVALTGIGNSSILKLKVLGVSPGNTTINVEAIDASDVQGTEVKALTRPIGLEVYHRIKGDANGDDRITAVDALIYLRFAVGLDISPYQLDPVEDDVTGDGRITAVDALVVLRAAVGLEDLG